MGQMMRDPATQAQLGNLLNDPAVLDQIIQSNPELRAMGPQVRELMRSEQFRSFLTDPAAMGQMRQMMQGGGGMPRGMGGMMGGAQGGAAPAAQGAGGPLFNPWAANTPDAGAGAGAGAGMGGVSEEYFARMMEQMTGGGGGGMGAFGGAPQLGAGPVMPPEERYQVCLPSDYFATRADPRLALRINSHNSQIWDSTTLPEMSVLCWRLEEMCMFFLSLARSSPFYLPMLPCCRSTPPRAEC